MQEDWEAEEEKKRLADEEATNAALIHDFDDIKARIEANRLLALRLHEEEIEQITIEERAKFLHDTIEAQRKKIKELNEEAKDPRQKTYKRRVAKEIAKSEDTVKVPVKVDVTEQGTKKRKGGHIKMIARKKQRPQPEVNSDDGYRKDLRIITLDSSIDSEVMQTKSIVTEVHKVSSPDGDYLVLYRANGNFRAFNYLMDLLHIFNRQDLFHLYELVTRQYLEVTLEGYELILWGDLKIMMESSMEENDLNGTVIHMLVERRYPHSKRLLQRMIDLGLEVEKERRVWVLANYHTTNGIQFTMLNRHKNWLGSQLTLLLSKELASPRSNSSWRLAEETRVGGREDRWGVDDRTRGGERRGRRCVDVGIRRMGMEECGTSQMRDLVYYAIGGCRSGVMEGCGRRAERVEGGEKKNWERRAYGRGVAERVSNCFNVLGQLGFCGDGERWGSTRAKSGGRARESVEMEVFKSRHWLHVRDLFLEVERCVVDDLPFVPHLGKVMKEVEDYSLVVGGEGF
ncbi:hypothetical protein Tco_1327314 [Tanacetum coccineum]